MFIIDSYVESDKCNSEKKNYESINIHNVDIEESKISLIVEDDAIEPKIIPSNQKEEDNEFIFSIKSDKENEELIISKGENYTANWIITNNGEKIWSKDTVLLCKNYPNLIDEIKVGKVKPKDYIKLNVNIKALVIPLRYELKLQLHSNKAFFGNIVSIIIIAKLNEEEYEEQSFDIISQMIINEKINMAISTDRITMEMKENMMKLMQVFVRCDSILISNVLKEANNDVNVAARKLYKYCKGINN